MIIMEGYILFGGECCAWLCDIDCTVGVPTFLLRLEVLHVMRLVLEGSLVCEARPGGEWSVITLTARNITCCMGKNE